MAKHSHKLDNMGQWPDMVGTTVMKHSGKPFKDGRKIAVVKKLTANTYSGKLAFMMRGHETIVDCHQVLKAPLLFILRERFRGIKKMLKFS
jgi:hypothetical protein